ncbi:hypothetical protein [Aliamphritea ceti]|uniref:hypothetical protein n=1 Tax=Aliamphritea ceti TaxID=1524258 RepID=UPI0021C273C5|nr:hypothetical protein [Aliamphritea ceti]
MGMGQLRRHIEAYLIAKDNNKPHLMPQVFIQDAELRMQVDSNNINFPPKVSGEAEITATLVQRFNEAHQNIYTFCLPESLSESMPDEQGYVTCRWFVCMQDKRSTEIKIGAGWYRWYAGDQQIERLDIEIQQMNLSLADKQSVIFSWAQRLPWPWCSAEIAVETLPCISEMDALREFLVHGQS